MGFKARSRRQQHLWYLTLTRKGRGALGTWSEVAGRLATVFPRLRPAHGLQDSFKHELFDVVIDLGSEPEVSSVALLVRWRGRHPNHSARHPLWPVLCRARKAISAPAADGGELFDAYTGNEIDIPPEAADLPLPKNDLERVYDVPVEPRGPLSGIDELDWSSWRHAHGSATDIPALLRALRSSDDGVRYQAWCTLYDNLYHDGAVYEAALHAVPWLLALVEHPSTPDRPGLLRFLLDLCMGLPEDFGATKVPWAIAKGAPMLLRLAHGRSALRIPAIYLLATLPRNAKHARPLVNQLLADDSDPMVRANAAYAVGITWKPTIPDLQILGRSLESELPGERFAAALAMYRADYVSPAVIEVFIAVLTDPGPYRPWAEACPWGGIDAGAAALDQLHRLHRDIRWALRLRFIALIASKRNDLDWPHSGAIALDLLALAFGGQRVNTASGADLEQDQRLVLLAIATCNNLWQSSDAADVVRRLAALGLPTEPKRLAAFIKVESGAGASSRA